MWNPKPQFAKNLLDRRYKKALVRSYLGPQRKAAREWTRSRGRPDNFYYGLSLRNTQHLISLLAFTFSAPRDYVAQLASELSTSPSILVAADQLGVDPGRLCGRRLGWYVVTRLTSPTLVVETGVHDGIGAVVLTEALRRNSRDGAPGSYRGTDIDPTAGWLLRAADIDAAIFYGDSLASLEGLPSRSADLFINDSDHSADYEYREYKLMTDRLSARAVILGDNSHATDSLMRYSQEMNRNFIFFDERPEDHWYPGAGIGISLPR